MISMSVCECVRKRAAARRFEGAAIPPEYASYTFSTWAALGEDVATKREAYETAREWSQTGAVSTDSAAVNGLAFYGPTGRGKSGLAAAALLPRLQRGEVLLWIDYRGFVRKIYDTMDTAKGSGPTYDELVSTASNAPILCWDDFGDRDRAKLSDYQRDIVYDVISHRYNNRLPLLITTNLDPEGVYAQMGDRIGDRLLKLCYWQPLGGPNLRFVR